MNATRSGQHCTQNSNHGPRLTPETQLYPSNLDTPNTSHPTDQGGAVCPTLSYSSACGRLPEPGPQARPNVNQSKTTAEALGKLHTATQVRCLPARWACKHPLSGSGYMAHAQRTAQGRRLRLQQPRARGAGGGARHQKGHHPMYDWHRFS